MKVLSLKKLYAIHSWVGIVTGILLFVVAFTGALAVFAKPELKYWAHPPLQTQSSVDYQKVEDAIQTHAQTLPASYLEEVVVFLPGARNYEHLTVLFEDHESQSGVLLTYDNDMNLINENQGSVNELFQLRQTDFADFIANLHADLHLGRPVGLLLTGLLGLTMLASVITGFVIHRQKLRQLFTLRKTGAFDITLSDAHRLFGVWGMVFHGVIAFTGAFLGLATVILIPAAAYISFNGDQEKLVETFTTIPTPVLTQQAAPTQIAKILAHETALHPDLNIEVVTVMGLNDSQGMVYLNATNATEVARQLIQYHAATGERQDQFGQFSKLGGVSSPVLDLMFPLHFGNFAGVFSKTLWTILGLACALIPLSGLMMWVNKKSRQQQASISPQMLDRLNRFIIGSCGGLVLACALLFPGQLMVNSYAFSEQFMVFSFIFFGSWLMYTLSCFVIQPATALRLLIGLSGLSLLGSATLHWLQTPSFMLFSTAGVINIILCLMGITLLALVVKKQRISQSPLSTSVEG